jgi:hypothetical protein
MPADLRAPDRDDLHKEITMTVQLEPEPTELAAWNALFDELKRATIGIAKADRITPSQVATLTDAMLDPRRRVLVATLILALLR